jgi:CPA2 family monovalent cation:H+ antiporter-2
MHDLHLFADLVIVLSVALAVAWAFSRLKLPTVVGFLAAGVVLGPGATGAISDPHDVEILAEIGIILLLFSIGLEVSLKELQRLALFVFGGGGLQMCLTAGVAAGGAMAVGYGWRTATFMGLICGLSSTAIVLNELREQDDINSVQGRGMLGVLVFQDLAVVPLILLVPLLGGGEQQTAAWMIVLKAVGVIGSVWAVATYVFPWVAERIVGTRRRELFTMFTVVVAVGTAYASGAAGLSLALGAFLAGLVISESPYSHQMVAEVEPFKDLFNSLFFVSMGLLLKPAVVIEYPLTVAGLVAAVVLVKALIAGLAVGLLGYGLRVAILVGMGLAQVGEFSFILAREGAQVGLLSQTEYGLFIATAVITMSMTPFLLRNSSDIAQRVARLFDGDTPAETDATASGQPPGDSHGQTRLDDHVIIVGFGTNGRRVARVLKGFEAPYVVAELNPQTVRRHGDDEPIVFGDAAREPILKQLGIQRARALLLTAGDRDSVRRTAATARRLNPDVSIVARTRFLADLPELRDDGATHIVVDEAETSLEMISQALQAYGVPSFDILRERELIRRENLAAADIAGADHGPTATAHPKLASLAGSIDSDVIQIRAECLPGGAATIDQVLGGIGIKVVARMRSGELEADPAPDSQLEPEDVLVVVGGPDAVRAARDRCLLSNTDADDG